MSGEVVKDCVINEIEADTAMNLQLMTGSDKPKEDQVHVFSKDSMKLIVGDNKLSGGFHMHNEINASRDIPVAENDNVNEDVARKRARRNGKTLSNRQGRKSAAFDSGCLIQGIC